MTTKKFKPTTRGHKVIQPLSWMRKKDTQWTQTNSKWIGSKVPYNTPFHTHTVSSERPCKVLDRPCWAILCLVSYLRTPKGGDQTAIPVVSGWLALYFLRNSCPKSDMITKRETMTTDGAGMKMATIKHKTTTKRHRTKTKRHRTKTKRHRTKTKRNRTKTKRNRTKTKRNRTKTKRKRTKTKRNRTKTKRHKTNTNGDKTTMNRHKTTTETHKVHKETENDCTDTPEVY